MQFRVHDDVFERCPDYCVGLVVVEGIANTLQSADATHVLREAEQHLVAAYTSASLRDAAELKAWRAPFNAARINHAKYKPSVEALASRVVRGDQIPALTPGVDLANAVSLRHLVPLGAHDLDRLVGDLTVGPLARPMPFHPMGGGAAEQVDVGEFVYADGEQVRTRRWVWRQGEHSKVTEATTRIAFPIDGFVGVTDVAVREATASLVTLLGRVFGVAARAAFLDSAHRAVALDLPPSRQDAVIQSGNDFRMAGTAYREPRPVTFGQPAEEPDPTTASEVSGDDDPHQRDAVDEVLRRRTVDVVIRGDLEQRLRRGDRLRVKFGVDPTGPKLHLGHAVQLRKLREFQQLGHVICLVVGDFTAQIGDASDKTAMRQMLSEEEIYEHLKSYRKQISKVLDVDAVEWTYNNDWLGPLRFRDIVELASKFTVAQMLERENFSLRFAAHQPIGLQEFMYPLMQGYDSVALKADVEIGGTEQLFNLMAGRTLQQAFGQRPQAVITCALLLGTDGLKMSKTAGNCIFIEDSAKDMFGKLMSITDAQILPYFELCTDVPAADLEEIARELAGGVNPMAVKKRLAQEVTRLYHTEAQAVKALQLFEQEVQRKELPDQIPDYVLHSGEPRALPDLLQLLGLVPSKSEARRLVLQNGVRIDGEVISDPMLAVVLRDGMLVQVGKRKFARVRLQI